MSVLRVWYNSSPLMVLFCILNSKYRNALDHSMGKEWSFQHILKEIEEWPVRSMTRRVFYQENRGKKVFQNRLTGQPEAMLPRCQLRWKQRSGNMKTIVLQWQMQYMRCERQNSPHLSSIQIETNLGHTPDILHQNLHFNKISRWFQCTIMLVKKNWFRILRSLLNTYLEF